MEKATPFDEIKECLKSKQSFVLEAGAGSGKTYTLIQTINHIIESQGSLLLRTGQKIACITYTNVAKNEIIERVENNPLVVVSTIHEFLWDSIKNYQTQLHIELESLNKEYKRQHDDGKKKKNYKYVDNLLDKTQYNNIDYHDYGRNFEKGKIEHDDVILLSNYMFKNYALLSDILANKYPFLFIDEYQDTTEVTVQTIVDFHLSRNTQKVLLGFFGDSHQKIYDDGIGSLAAYSSLLKFITKTENFRCSIKVIDVLNKIRSNIQQIPVGKNITGSVQFIHSDTNLLTNSQKFQKVEKYLTESQNWKFTDPKNTKVLTLTNRSISGQLDFSSIYDTYNKRYTLSTAQRLFKRDDHFTSFFLGSKENKKGLLPEDGVEHLIGFYNNSNYGEVIRLLQKKGFQLKTHQDKVTIDSKIKALIDMREKGTIVDVLNLLRTGDLLHFPQKISDFENFILQGVYNSDEDKKRASDNTVFYESFKKIKYSEFINLFQFIQDNTPFSTKHGTKGDEFDNVLVVIDDDAWKQMYNFNNYFNNNDSKSPDRFLRTRNLFYVCCSRARVNLAVLSLSNIDGNAIQTVQKWFGAGNTKRLSDL